MTQIMLTIIISVKYIFWQIFKVRVCSRFVLQNYIALWSLTPPKTFRGRAATLTPLFLQLKIRSLVCAKDPVVYIIARRGLYQSSRGLYQSSRGLYQSSRGLYHRSPWFISSLAVVYIKAPGVYIKAPVVYIIDPRLFCIVNFAQRFCSHVPWFGSKIPVVWIKDPRGMDQRSPWHETTLSAFLSKIV